MCGLETHMRITSKEISSLYWLFDYIHAYIPRSDQTISSMEPSSLLTDWLSTRFIAKVFGCVSIRFTYPSLYCAMTSLTMDIRIMTNVVDSGKPRNLWRITPWP